jgi:hypothetical protein
MTYESFLLIGKILQISWQFRYLRSIISINTYGEFEGVKNELWQNPFHLQKFRSLCLGHLLEKEKRYPCRAKQRIFGKSQGG